MRQFYPAIGIAILLAGRINLAEAQTPAPAPVLEYPFPLAINTASLGAESLPNCGLDAKAWSVDLLLGLPTGVRVQRALGDDVARAWFVEGFGGLEAVFPMAGGGIRRRSAPFCGDRDSLTVSPGLDVYVLYNTFHDGGGWLGGGPRTFGLITSDVEIFWHHAFNDRCGTQLGVNLGAGISRGVVPVASVVFGLRF